MKKGAKALAKKIPGAISCHRAIMKNKLKRRNEVIRGNYPKLIDISITNRCNSKCVYCPRTQLVAEGITPVKDMNFKMLEGIVDNIKSSKKLPNTIELGGLGDPMLYKELSSAINLVKSKLPQVRLYLVTNGIFFPEEIQRSMIDVVDSLQISVNFHSKELYKKYNGVDRFESVVSNVEAFLQRKGNRKPRTTIQILDIFDNREYLQEFKDFWSRKINSNDVVHIRPFNSFAGLIDATQYTNIDCHNDLYPCGQIFYTLRINVDGDCHPCCMGAVTTGDDPLCIGNIQEKSIDELYAPKSLVQWVRSTHKRGDYDKIPTCKRCLPYKRERNYFFKIAGRWV